MQHTFDIYETKIDVIEAHRQFNSFSVFQRKIIESDKIKKKSEMRKDRYPISVFLGFSKWKYIDTLCLVIFSMISYLECYV